jgi:glycogen phosphorylase
MTKTADDLKRYECGPLRFDSDDYYDRHLLFDHVVSPEKASVRERFEAMARSIRDVLAQRWVQTERSYDHQNPKEVYYLSMEFLIGRTMASAIANLKIAEFVERDFASDLGHDLEALFEEEPDAGLGNGGLGRLAACFLDSLATMSIPAIGYGLRYEYGMFRQEIKDGRQVEHPDNWLLCGDPWEVVRPDEQVEVRLNCAFQMREGRLTVVPNVPTIVVGIPCDRPVVGYGGCNINTLRLWNAAAHEDFNFLEFSRGDFFDAVHEKVAAFSTPMTRRPEAAISGSSRSTFWWPARWPTWCGGSGGGAMIGTRFPRKQPSS